MALIMCDFPHLFLVARLAMERGDRKPAERMLRTYRILGGRDGDVEARRRAQKLAALLANGSTVDASQLPPGDGSNPWAAAQKRRRRDAPAINFKLTNSQVQVAEAIEKIFTETTRALSAWNLPLGSIQVDTSRHRKDPWLALPDWVRHERIKVYLPWVERWSKILVIQRPHQTLSAVELVMLIVISGHSVRAIARSWNAGRDQIIRNFRRTLDGYADIKRTVRQEHEAANGGL